MKADSIYFKGHSCFKKDWAGFDTIKPINVIIGRNNSGKSHLLDLAEALCDGKLFDREWKYRCHGVLEEKPLKEAFPANTRGGDLGGNHWGHHGQYFVGAEVTWEVTSNEVSDVKFPDEFALASPSQNISFQDQELFDARLSRVCEILKGVTHQLNGTAFRRLFADRDIKTELPITELALGPDGTGATNIIRRFITSEKLPRDVIQEELLAALNSIFGSDGQFSEREVEGPSDRIYLKRWIELYTDGRLREGRDYRCVFYGGALIARVQFTSPEDEDEVTELANLFQINHNLIVVCDGDREAEDSDLKTWVERIREEVGKIDRAHIWITEAKEIENYLPGSVLEKTTGLSPLPDPKKDESWSSYAKKHMQRERTNKVALAISSIQYMTKEVMEKQFEWKEQMEQIVKRIESWNGN